MDLPEIDFGRVRSMGSGGQREAFEQFVCELAAEECPHPDAVFTRLHGAGGDGGVECFWALPDGGEYGWQAKFWVDGRNVDNAQLDGSVATALKVHPRLVRYTIAIPVDPTGPTAREGKSLHDKVYQAGGWLDEWNAAAAARGMTVEFRVEWRTNLVRRLRSVDTSGVRTRYWFDADVVTDAWWQNRLDDAIQAARPRYIPELSIDVPAVAAIAALCGDPTWQAAVADQIVALEDRLADVRRVADATLVADLSAVYATGNAVIIALEEDLAHLPDSDSRNANTLAPSASSRHRISRDSRNTR
jgi:hypothetical protein